MNFHLEFFPKHFDVKIEHQHPIFLIGSCFTENIGSKFRQHKFDVVENPNGILFNPISISKAITRYIENKNFTKEDLFFQNDLWNSWEHHTRFSDIDADVCLQKINTAQDEGHEFLKKAEWVVITLGSAFVYQHEGNVVANCHKVPTDKFNKRLLSVEEVLSALDNVMHRIFMFNSNAKIVFTISPVRHLREGFIENNRSKAVLIQAVHHLVNKFNKLYYFPAYELVIDDLRDYRFYAEDLVHPNYAATNYVWDKIKEVCISQNALEIMKEVNEINAAVAHKPFNPTSSSHIAFLEKYAAKVKVLKRSCAYINFDVEENYFAKR